MEKRLVCLIVPETKYCKDIVFFNVVKEIMHVTLSKQRQGRCTQKWTYMHQSCRGCSGEQHCMKFMPKIAQLSPPSTKHGGKGDFGAGPKLAAVPRPLRPHPCTLSSPSPSLWSYPHQCWITQGEENPSGQRSLGC